MNKREKLLPPDDAALAFGSPDTRVILREEIDGLRENLDEMKQLSRLKEQYLSIAMHELSTPLTAIKAYIETLAENYGDPEFKEGPAFLEVLERETARLIRIVDRTLQLSRLASRRQLVQKTQVDLRGIVDEVRETLQPVLAERSLSLDVQVADDLSTVDADPDLLKQVVINLIHNAMKFSPRERTITLSATGRPGIAEIAVRDEGYGIAADELQRIFDPYFRSVDDRVELKRGTGLGLAIVKTIVNQHGGRVYVESELDQGTTFRFTLPHA